jgi:hypothetical protein
MHVVWKRPDGFVGAEPSDFFTLAVGEHSKLWLHKENIDTFPFRISGGWQDDDSHKLNNLINLLAKSETEFNEYVKNQFDNSLKDSHDEFFEEINKWLTELSENLKGDTWEVEIMTETFNHLKEKVTQAKSKLFS